MNKKELAAAMSLRLGMSKKEAEAALDTALELVTETVAGGDKVQLVGFGTLEVRSRKVRKGTVIGQAGSGMLQEVPTLQFRPGKELREAIQTNNRREK